MFESFEKIYLEKNKKYKDNFKQAAEIMEVLFPEGIILKTKEDFVKFHLLVQKISKLTRFMVSDLTHTDSIVDEIIYTAILLDNCDNIPIKRGE